MEPDVLQVWGLILLLTVGPVAVVGAGAYFLLRRSALGRAILSRGASQSTELAELANEVDELRHQMVELQERLDFSERMVTQLMAGEHPRALGATRAPTPPETPAVR